MTETDNNKEKYCSNCQHDAKKITEYPCNECSNAYTSKFVVKTNYDKIIEMSLDELAVFLNNISAGRKKIDSAFVSLFGKEMYNNFDGTKAIKKWLESEAIK